MCVSRVPHLSVMVKCLKYVFTWVSSWKTVLNLLSLSRQPLSCSLMSFLNLLSSLFSPHHHHPLHPSCLSLSLPSPDDSRTPALAQTWPTLTWNTRCADEEEEDEDEEVVEGGRGERKTKKSCGWVSIHFQCNQLKLNVNWYCNCRPIVHQYFLTGLLWPFHTPKTFFEIFKDNKLPDLIELKVKKSQRKEGFKRDRTQQTWAKSSWIYLNTEEGTWAVEFTL